MEANENSDSNAGADFRVTFGLMPPDAPFFLDDWRKLFVGKKSKNAVYLMQHRGKLPAPRDIDQDELVWLVQDVRDWWASRPRVTRNPKDAESTGPSNGKPRGRPRLPAGSLTNAGSKA